MKLIVFADKTRQARREAVEKALPLLRSYAEVMEVDLSTVPEGAFTGSGDFALVFGGDGSMLRVARAMGEHQIPTVGVNLGKLGFLTEVAPEELASLLDILRDNKFKIVQRMLLHCVVKRGGVVLRESLAMNDAVVSRGSFSRLISIGLRINDEDVTDYNGDGLIVATPVGSTAHSLAAGGPILEADLRAFTITPICPHTLSNRPLVIPANKTIEMVVNPPDLPVMLTLDGQVGEALRPGDRVIVSEAKHHFNLIQTGRQSYYSTLRTKLGWGGHPNYG